MKRIIILFLSFSMGLCVHAQILERHNNASSIDLSNNRVRLIIPQKDSVTLVTRSGGSLSFSIEAIKRLKWAEAPEKIKELEKQPDMAIIYDSKKKDIYILNADKNCLISLYNSDGKLIRSSRGTSTNVADLPDGMYIVSCNGNLTAKFVKK